MARLIYEEFPEPKLADYWQISSILIQGSLISILLMVEMVSDGPGEDPGDL